MQVIIFTAFAPVCCPLDSTKPAWNIVGDGCVAVSWRPCRVAEIVRRQNGITPNRDYAMSARAISAQEVSAQAVSAQAKHQAKTKETKGAKHAKHRGGRIEPSPRPRTTLDDRLEQGLEESFPASDPVSLTQPPGSAHDARKR
jgi:hypothetical protein